MAEASSTLSTQIASSTTITLSDFDRFLKERSVPANTSPSVRLFEVGVDDVHDALKMALGSVRRSLYVSMYGYDDEELNDIIMQKVLDDQIFVQITLDKSQAGGVHEKKLLDADRARGLASFGTHFAIGQSLQHRILHSKGGIIDGWLMFEGSTNWSSDGEGTFVVATGPGGPRYAAQANTLTLITDPFAISRFHDRLNAEHAVAKAQESADPTKHQRKMT